MSEVKKVVLAYSDGLDTSIIIPWLKEHYNNCEVIAMCGNVGQKGELEGLEERAKASGASKLYIEDLTDEFVEDYVIPTMQAGADYEGYLLGTSFARPDHQHIEQCRQYDRPHGNAAGRHGHCGSAPESCLSCCSEIRKKAVRHRSRAAFTTTRMCLYETTQTIHSAGNGPIPESYLPYATQKH